MNIYETSWDDFQTLPEAMWSWKLPVVFGAFWAKSIARTGWPVHAHLKVSQLTFDKVTMQEKNISLPTRNQWSVVRSKFCCQFLEGTFQIEQWLKTARITPLKKHAKSSQTSMLRNSMLLAKLVRTNCCHIKNQDFQNTIGWNHPCYFRYIVFFCRGNYDQIQNQINCNQIIYSDKD